MQRGLRLLLRVGAIHRRPTLRPVLGCENASVAVAGSESLTLIVVPIGGLRLNLGKSEPSRNVLGEAFAKRTPGADTVTVALAVLFEGLGSAPAPCAASWGSTALKTVAELVFEPFLRRATTV